METKNIKIYSQTALSRHLGVSREQVNRWCSMGAIPFERNGRQFVFNLLEVKKKLQITHVLIKNKL